MRVVAKIWKALRPRGIAHSTVVLAVVAIAAVMLLPSVSAQQPGFLAGSPSMAASASTGSPMGLTSSVELAKSSVLTSCPVGQNPMSDAYDPADGYVYVSNFDNISIVKPPCSVVKTVSIPGDDDPYGIAYDPLAKEIVAIEQAYAVDSALVLRGTSLVTIVSLGGAGYHCPSYESYDPASGTMLIADMGQFCAAGGGLRGGIDILNLSIVGGITRASVILDAFDRGNDPENVLVADGYIFSAGGSEVFHVDVFSDRTFAYLGSFVVKGPCEIFCGAPLERLAWDPLNDTVVMVGLNSVFRESVIFLNANSVDSGKFTFSYLPIPASNVFGVAYSPATQEIYIAGVWTGDSVLELSRSGALTYVYLSPGAGADALTYDPVDRDMYVCGYGNDTIPPTLYVTH